MISTGFARVRPEHVGPTWKPMPVWLWSSRRWTDPLPINVFVIEHREGLVLFDTGQDRASITDPGYFPSAMDRAVNRRVAQLQLEAEDTLEAGLSQLGYRPEEIDTVVISHLHPDNIGGLPVLGHARIVISQDEWASLDKPMPQTRGLYRDHIDLPGLRWDRITPEPLGDASVSAFTEGHDLFADGSMVLLPTPGHTPGSLSLLVSRDGHSPLLMVGDLTYDDTLMQAGLPSGMCKKSVTRTVMERVNSLRDAFPGLAVLPAHDPGSADRLEAA